MTRRGARVHGVWVMLAILAIFGALGAGLIVDVFSKTTTDDEADTPEDPAEGESTGQIDPGVENMLDWAVDDEDQPDSMAAAPTVPPTNSLSGDVVDGMPVSDDIEDPEHTPEMLAGTQGDDILGGGMASDTLMGDAGHDLLSGRGGDDAIFGGDGQDQLGGGTGNDTLTGENGDDTLIAGEGNDALLGGAGNDSLAGQAGDDLLHGDAGDDSLMGGEGADTLNGGDGADWLAGGSDQDLLQGGAGQDTLDGGAGHDTIWGQSPDMPDTEVDFLNGGTGDDVLMISRGDIAMGGDGSDSFQLIDIAPDGPVAQISDFNPAEDDLIIYYDSDLHQTPVLTAEPVAGSQDVTLMLDGVAVAIVRDAAGLSVANVTLRAA